MHHGPEFTVILIVVLALLIGAATRMISAKLRAPFTVLMLLIGLGLGVWMEGSGAAGGHGLLSRLGAGADISSDLIIFVFLPALIFESAYGLEVHAFRKALGAISILAVPALMVCTGLTALLMTVLVPESWGWSFTAMLVFGVLISATDPVAVVALMRELGVSKRLATLIEGESLMNDGTAIVLFTVLVGVLATPGMSVDAGSVALDFITVVGGGLAVGFAFSLIASWWMGRTYNDPLVEITLTVVLCYAAMLVAEGMLHVSGVMAVVVTGLWMSGPGRTRISPEVGHFLHQFWEMLAYIANTLLFFLVGIVIGTNIEGAGLAELGLIVAAWAGIMTIRTAVTFAFRPLANLTLQNKISVPDACAASWGGLRGAVSIALALIVAHTEGVPDELASRMVIVTTGVVLLSLIINGTTMGALLRHFGYDKAPPADELAQLTAQSAALGHVRHDIAGLANSRALRTVRWKAVEERIAERAEEIDRQAASVTATLASGTAAERAEGYWRQALRIERGAYWRAFSQGTLSGAAVNALSQEIDAQLDKLSNGEADPPATRHPVVGPVTAWVRRTVRKNDLYARMMGSTETENLSYLYDLARGEAYAAAAVLERVDQLDGMDDAIAEQIRTTYRGYLASGKERLEELRVHLPEIAGAVENRIAERLALNFERAAYEHQSHDGTLDHSVAERFMGDVSVRIQELHTTRRRMPIPDVAALLGDVPLFEPLDAAGLAELAKSATRSVVPKGEYVFREGDQGDSLYVIARGAMHVLREIDGKETLLDVFGGGDILGEMALLTGEARTASIRAATPVTVVKIGRDAFCALMDKHDHLEAAVWTAFAQRRADNLLRDKPGFAHIERDARNEWIADGEHVALEKGATRAAPDGVAHALVVAGAVFTETGRHAAPELMNVTASTKMEATVDTRIVLLPSPPAA